MSNSKRRILVVDDDPKHLQTTREILELEGYEVTVHDTPFRTTELVNNTRPDLVLLDVNMPALSGDRLCSLIRAHGSRHQTAILFYSSNDEETLRASVQIHGANGYVCKGDIPGLRRKVAQVLAA
jgi:DNA-binding response OmpR family regulator